MIDLSNGIVKVTEGLIVYPNYSFKEFKQTSFYKKQDGIRILYLDGQQVIDGKNYIVSMFFKNEKIYILSLICCNMQYSEMEEKKRKELHDEILKQYNIVGEKEFAWGRVTSDYDARSNCSSINLLYF